MDNIRYKDIMRRHGLREMNKSDERFANQHWKTGRKTSQKFNTVVLQDTDKVNTFKIAFSEKC